MAEIKDEVFINFARELTAKLTEVVKNIDLYKLAYEKGRAEEREIVLDEVIQTLAKSKDTILSDKQYYTLKELRNEYSS